MVRGVNIYFLTYSRLGGSVLSYVRCEVVVYLYHIHSSSSSTPLVFSPSLGIHSTYFFTGSKTTVDENEVIEERGSSLDTRVPLVGYSLTDSYSSEVVAKVYQDALFVRNELSPVDVMI